MLTLRTRTIGLDRYATLDRNASMLETTQVLIDCYVAACRELVYPKLVAIAERHEHWDAWYELTFEEGMPDGS